MTRHRKSDRESNRPSWGVYCLANDAVLDWVLPLLESLRTFAPSLPLLFIPFDSRVAALRRIASSFGYGLFETPECSALETLGRVYYPDSEFHARGFRKLACFQGPFDYFFSLDSDVLVLGPLEDLQEAFVENQLDLLAFDTDIDQVYLAGPWRDERLSRGARGFNAGVFAGRAGLLDAERLARELTKIPSDWQSILTANAEQAFLNFFAEESSWRLSGAHEICSDTCSTCWAAAGELESNSGGYRLRSPGRWDDGWRVRFAHWAGVRLSAEMPNRKVHEHFREAANARLERFSWEP